MLGAYSWVGGGVGVLIACFALNRDRPARFFFFVLQAFVLLFFCAAAYMIYSGMAVLSLFASENNRKDGRC